MSIETSHSVVTSRNLSIGYPKITLYKNLNINAKQGELITILGKNGTGKTTLLRTLAGIQPALEGKLFLQEQEISNFSALELAQNMALVLTEKIPDSLLRVSELIAMGRQAHTDWFDNLTQADQKIIDFAVAITNTSSLLNQFYEELSDGQKQKVQIARAIAQDTPILLLDEPTAHLDVHHRMESFKLLQELAHNHHKTVIIATHEVSLAIQLADQIWLFQEKYLETGSPQELLDKKSISQAFDSDLIQFNHKKGIFEYH